MLIIAAAEFEASPLIKFLREANVHVEAAVAGIGALEAARTSATLGDLARGRDVLFIGTCGTFSPFHSPEVVLGRTAHWLPYDLRIGKSYKIMGTLEPIQLPSPAAWTRGLRAVDVICSSTISLDPWLPEAFSPNETVENIEYYAIIPPVLQRCRSFHGVFATTNRIGPEAHQEWKANFLKAAEQTARTIGPRIVAAMKENPS